MKQIAVLLTCHNRKEKTLPCLKSVFAQVGLNSTFQLEVFLVDDASTDGTAIDVKKNFPDVHIIPGDGNLFWNRGMYLAWQTASEKKYYDYYLWLNDDTMVFENAVLSLLINHPQNAIICGSTNSIITNKVTYGGYDKRTKMIIAPTNNFQPCHYFNGNCVLVPHPVFEKLGNLDPIFHHAVGDFDYGLRAKKIGIELFIAPTIIGTCESHTEVPRWRSPSNGFMSRIKNLYSASSGCYPPQFFVFERRHHGLFLAIVHLFSIHLRATIPRLWENRH
ncbi:MAG: glycosyltransferase family 2 protein [Sphingobacteriales bacterium]|nr:glycosyltransferase family 2 protein [Sphingobacteriales bacterium]